MLKNKASYEGFLNEILERLCFIFRSRKYKKFSIILLLSLSMGIFYCSSFAQDDFVYNAKGKRNPFIPLVTSDGRLIKLEARETTGGFALEGIIYDKISMSYAIVNGAVVKVGDMVGDYQVLKIEENKVIFIKDSQPFEVELKKEGE